MLANPTNPGAGDPQEPIDLRTVVLLVLAGGSVYLAYVHPAFGTALLVGVAVLLALHALVRRG